MKTCKKRLLVFIFLFFLGQTCQQCQPEEALVLWADWSYKTCPELPLKNVLQYKKRKLTEFRSFVFTPLLLPPSCLSRCCQCGLTAGFTPAVLPACPLSETCCVWETEDETRPLQQSGWPAHMWLWLVFVSQKETRCCGYSVARLQCSVGHRASSHQSFIILQPLTRV